MLLWDKKYELGISAIDSQHKRLFEIAGELADLLENAIEGEDVHDGMVYLVGELKDYTVFHFAYEESIFDKTGFEFAAAHKKEHDSLIAEIEAIDFENIDDDQVAFGKKLLKFVISWVFKHISGSDSLYKTTFIASGVC